MSQDKRIAGYEGTIRFLQKEADQLREIIDERDAEIDGLKQGLTVTLAHERKRWLAEEAARIDEIEAQANKRANEAIDAFKQDSEEQIEALTKERDELNEKLLEEITARTRRLNQIDELKAVCETRLAAMKKLGEERDAAKADGVKLGEQLIDALGLVKLLQERVDMMPTFDELKEQLDDMQRRIGLTEKGDDA